MNINGSGMLNQGPYIALVDINLCQSHKSSGSSDTNAANYMTAIVDATRGSASTDPMIAKVWMSLTEQGKQNNISLRLSASKSPSEVPPYGVFRLDYIGKDNSNVIQFNGYIDSTLGNLLFYETGANSSNTAMSLNPGTSDSGSGTITTGSGPVTTFDFNYNSAKFRRRDNSSDHCFDRLKINASKSVWRYGVYDNNNGSRVDQANPGFPVTAFNGVNTYYGYANYYGIGFQGLTLSSDGSPIAGLTVTDQRPGNTTTYNLSKVGGKLTKWTQHSAQLANMDGMPFTTNYMDMTGKTGSTSVTGFANWQMVWKNSPTPGFIVTGTQTCNGSGCTVTSITPAPVTTGAFNGIPISGNSESFGGQINIPSSTGDHVSTDPVYYFSQTTVLPGTATPTLYCLQNCPDATSVGLANGYTGGTAPSPYGGNTANQWLTAPDSGGTVVTYSFDAGGLKNGSTTPIAMIINNAAFLSSNSQYMGGVRSGRLFDTAFSVCTTYLGAGVCEPSNPTTYYTWETGSNQWNQTLWLTKTSDNSVVALDPPVNIPYTIPNDATTYGTWANKTIQLQFNGFGNLWGVPGYCVSPVDNSQVDCSVSNARYVSMFSLPDGATMTMGSTPLIVKALDAELRLADLGVGGTVCPLLTLNTLIPPTTGAHDMTDVNDPYYINIKPTGSLSIKVIDGIVQ